MLPNPNSNASLKKTGPSSAHSCGVDRVSGYLIDRIKREINTDKTNHIDFSFLVYVILCFCDKFNKGYINLVDDNFLVLNIPVFVNYPE